MNKIFITLCMCFTVLKINAQENIYILKDRSNSIVFKKEKVITLQNMIYEDLYNNHFRDDDSLEMLKIIVDNGGYDLMYLARHGKPELTPGINDIHGSVMMDASAEPGSMIDARYEAVNIAADEFFNK